MAHDHAPVERRRGIATFDNLFLDNFLIGSQFDIELDVFAHVQAGLDSVRERIPILVALDIHQDAPHLIDGGIDLNIGTDGLIKE